MFICITDIACFNLSFLQVLCHKMEKSLAPSAAGFIKVADSSLFHSC